MKKYQSVILLISIILTFAVNIVYLNELPQKVGVQITHKGEVSNQLPRVYFVVMAPIILLINYVVSRLSKDDEGLKAILVALIIIVLNIVTLYFNIN